MKTSPEKKPLPLWAIWLITLVAVITWCGTHPDEGMDPAWPIKTAQRA